MRVAAFLTADRTAAISLLAAWRVLWPQAEFVVFANDEDRATLQASAPGVEFRRDKPPTGKLAFVRALRREGFSQVAVAWHGGERILPLRVVALLLGCPVLAVDERGRERAVGLWRPWTWLPHLLRRAACTDALQYSRLAAAGYRCSVGLLVAMVRLPLRRWLG
ncbi:MAG: hypothetical protein ABIP94_12035 [Planctomycetota bacterium]